jgi:hypothetical protein
MTSKEFDEWLRANLASVHPELNAQDWDDFVHQVEDAESAIDEVFDDSVRDHVSDLTPTAAPDWGTMERMLEEDERLFDRDVRQHVERFQVPYNPTTWPILDARIAADEKLRRRLVYAKVLEIAAIFFVLLTFYNFFPLLIPSSETTQKDSLNEQSVVAAELPGYSAEQLQSTRTYPEPARTITNESASSDSQNLSLHNQDAAEAVSLSVTLLPQVSRLPGITSQEQIVPAPELFVQTSEGEDAVASVARVPADSGPHALPVAAIEKFPAPGIHVGMGTLLPHASSHASRVRFGMSASADVNTLFFPEEHFYTQGRSINFSEKEIVASGYSAGATLLFDFKSFLFETGLNYSFKSFSPNRNLFIGTSADKHTLDFENIALNVVSVPLYLHWKVAHKGPWKVYLTSGTSLHVIANANYDLIAENIYTSSAVQSGQQLQNQREVQRVREHMLDGAKFNSKGYLTLAGGLGLERAVSPRISVFAQPLYHYQIPFFGLIDQNGKHLQNGSMLFGTRVSLSNQ